MTSLSALCVDRIVQSLFAVPLLTSDLHQQLLERALACGRFDLVPSLVLATAVCLPAAPLPSFPLSALPAFADLTSLSLPNQDLAVASLAALLGSAASQLRLLDVSQNSGLRDAFFADLARTAPHLEDLCVDECRQLTHAALCEAVQCPSLLRLSCKAVRLTDSGFAEMCGVAVCPLRSLRIAKAKLRDETMPALVTFARSLRSLTLNFCFSLASLDFLSLLPLLADLDVTGCARLPEVPSVSLVSFKAEFCDGLHSVAPLCPSLQVLELGFLKGLPRGPTLELVASRFTALRYLRLQSQHMIIRDDFVVALRSSSGPSLVELQLSSCLLGDEGMTAIGAGFPALEICHLAGTWNEASDEAFELVSRQCPRLRSFSVGKLADHATDSAFVAMAGLQHLEMLDLNLHHLSDDGIERAPCMEHVHALSLRYCRRLTGDALLALAAKARTLQSLDVSQCTFPALVVERFLEQSSVSFLNVCGLDMSPAVLQRLGQRFPNVKVFAS